MTNEAKLSNFVNEPLMKSIMLGALKNGSVSNTKLRMVSELINGDVELINFFADTLVSLGDDIEVEEFDSISYKVSFLLENYIRTEEFKSGRVLKDAQFEVFKIMLEFFKGGGKDGYIKFPTGTGKTVMFIEFLKAVQLKALVVVPTNILVEQTSEDINEFGENLDYGAINMYTKEYQKPITIITYHSFVNQVRNGRLNIFDYDLLVLDEAHMALSPGASRAVKKFAHAIRLGFTATPDYSETKKLKHLLHNEIHSMRTKDAIEDGLLCGCRVILAMTDVSISEVSVQSGQYSKKELQKAINIEKRNKAAVMLYKEMFLGELAVAYCMDITHAESLEKCFNENGILAVTISKKTGRKERKTILEKFRNGEIKVLCNARVLIHGFDETRVSVGFNLYPSLSPVVVGQRGGRPLRLDKGNPFKIATIVDFLDKAGTGRYQPITFADFLNSAEILNRNESGFSSGGALSGNTDLPEIEGLNVVVDTKEVMEIVNNRRKYTLPKKDWIMEEELILRVKHALSNIFSPPREVEINNIHFLDFFRKEHPEWFSTHFAQAENVRKKEEREFFSPKIVEAIKDDFIRAQNEWVDTVQLSDELETSYVVVNRFIDEYFVEFSPIHLHDFKKDIKSRINFFPGFFYSCSDLRYNIRRIKCLHPFFANDIKVKIENQMKITGCPQKEDVKFYNVKEIADILEISYKKIDKFILTMKDRNFRKEFPGHFKNYKTENGLIELISELVLIELKNKFSKEMIKDVIKSRLNLKKIVEEAHKITIIEDGGGYITALGYLCQILKYNMPDFEFSYNKFRINYTCVVEDDKGNIFKGFGIAEREERYAKKIAAKQVYKKIMQKLRSEIENQS